MRTAAAARAARTRARTGGQVLVAQPHARARERAQSSARRCAGLLAGAGVQKVPGVSPARAQACMQP